MILTLENGNYDSSKPIANPNEQLLKNELSDEYLDFAILHSKDDLTYIQGRLIEEEDRILLEYQDGSVEQHFQADKLVSRARAISAFIWYLRNDDSWRTQFVWERIVV